MVTLTVNILSVSSYGNKFILGHFGGINLTEIVDPELQSYQVKIVINLVELRGYLKQNIELRFL